MCSTGDSAGLQTYHPIEVFCKTACCWVPARIEELAGARVVVQFMLSDKVLRKSLQPASDSIRLHGKGESYVHSLGATYTIPRATMLSNESMKAWFRQMSLDGLADVPDNSVLTDILRQSSRAFLALGLEDQAVILQRFELAPGDKYPSEDESEEQDAELGLNPFLPTWEKAYQGTSVERAVEILDANHLCGIMPADPALPPPPAYRPLGGGRWSEEQPSGLQPSIGGKVGPGIYVNRDINQARRTMMPVILEFDVKFGRVLKLTHENYENHPRQYDWHQRGYDSCGIVSSGREEHCIWDASQWPGIGVAEASPEFWQSINALKEERWYAQQEYMQAESIRKFPRSRPRSIQPFPRGTYLTPEKLRLKLR